MAVRLQGNQLQVLGLGTGQPQLVSLSTTTNLNSTNLNSGADSVRLWASVDCFIRFGDASVVATTSDHPLTAKLPEVFQLDGAIRIAGIVSSGTGTLFISVMQ